MTSRGSTASEILERREISFVVHGIPAPAGSKRGFVNQRTQKVIITDASKRSKPWQAAVAAAAHDAHDGAVLQGPLRLIVAFRFTRPAGHYGTGRNASTLRSVAPAYPTVPPDTTKLLRAIEDALTGILWRDDSQIVDQYAVKVYAEQAGCSIAVSELMSTVPA